jgi:hypothetical protein
LNKLEKMRKSGNGMGFERDDLSYAEKLRQGALDREEASRMMDRM